MTDSDMIDTGKPVKGAKLALALMILAYVLNFLDRQIISILAVPIRAEFHLNDAQLGWLGGLAFGSVYSVLALPAAWLADRFSRRWIMAGALFLWSGFTAACGFAASYGQLFAARMGVGVGEAGGVPPAYSLICDYFPPKSRARALAIYSLGIPIGIATGTFVGGLLAEDWRRAFITVGVAGLVASPLFLWLVREPKRASPAEKPQAFFKVARFALGRPSFWLMAVAAGFASLVGYGFLFWFPSYLVRSMHFDIHEASRFIALLTLLGGVAGIAGGGWLADWLGRKGRAAYALIPAAAWLVAAPLYALGVVATSPVQAFLLFLVPQALGLMWFGPIVTAVQHLAPPRARSQVSAMFLLVVNLIGLGLGPYVFGKLSDLLKPQYGVDALKYAFLYGLGFYPLAAVLLIVAARFLRRDWVE